MVQYQWINIAMIHLIWVFRTSLGWKLTEIICAHTLVFDLAETTGFQDGASIAICQFCLRRGPCYELTSFPWLRAFIVSRWLPGLTQQRWHALQQSHSNLTDDWEVLLISELFVFPDWCRGSLGGCCSVAVVHGERLLIFPCWFLM